MSVVTIRGKLGSGAPEIGKIIAEKLHADYVDREIIADVAQRLRRSKEEIAGKEMPPGSLGGRISEALEHNAYYRASAYLPTWEMPLEDTQYLEGLESVIKKLAESASILILGRGSQFILKDYPGSLHVLVIASPNTRLRRVMDTTKLDKESAHKEIARVDNSRRLFIKRYFHAEMEDALYYDLVLNSDLLRFEDVASIVVDAVPLK